MVCFWREALSSYVFVLYYYFCVRDISCVREIMLVHYLFSDGEFLASWVSVQLLLCLSLAVIEGNLFSVK